MSGAIILAAGGTGGHLFPAEALAGELIARGREVILVSDPRGQSHIDLVGGPLSRIERHTVRAAAVSGQSLAGRIKGLAEITAGTWQARSLLNQLKPAAAIGFGGYPALPTMLAATRAGLASIIHEQNAVLGRVNRLLAPRVSAIAVSFADTSKLEPGDFAKVTVIGNPVRPSVRAVRGAPYAPPRPDGEFDLMVLGGSQGATVLSQVVPQALCDLPPDLRARLRVTQQCRAEDLDGVRKVYADAAMNADLSTFFDDIPNRLARTHLIISRAGASTVSEAAVAGRPALLVPYPHATDDHQTANAKALCEPGGGWSMAQPDFTAVSVAAFMTNVMTGPDKLEAAAAAALNVGRADAAPRLADLVEQLISGRNGNSGREEAA